MPKRKTQLAKERLLGQVRKQRLKYITILPSLITIVNGVCGFTAIVLAGKGTEPSRGQLSYFSMAGYMILLAMLADMLDGRLARISQSTSSFGGQLDSLCDTISFGVAPAFLMLKVLEHTLVGFAEPSPIVGSFLQRFIWLAAAAYISCAAIRLARFNVENEEDESAHMSFMGLPTPAAAGVVVSLIIFHQQTLPELLDKGSQGYRICENIIMYAMPPLVLGVAGLMVSRIRYPHVLNQYLKGKKPFAYLIWALFFVALIIWSRLAALVFIFCGFAASSFVKWLYYKVIRRNDSILQTFVGWEQSADRDSPIANRDER
jgi:CDP-diacylglycerol--serine O-phosphatidyltransferase